MAKSKQEIQEKLQRLHENYAAELPDKVAEIESAWLDLLKSPADNEQRSLVANLCHTLAGSGSSFGFAEITRLSREIELRIKELDEVIEQIPPHQQATIVDLFAQLKDQANQAATTL